MQIAPLPENESERLAALRAMLILDTPPEQRFDKIVRFAAMEFNVPVALISLIDHERQWFKARFGIDVCETRRDVSFCSHTILNDRIMVIDDARKDARFVGNPLVTGELGVRFYAGAPLATQSGLRLGTLCIIDHQPRTLDSMELGILGTLRDLVMLELTQTTQAIHA